MKSAAFNLAFKVHRNEMPFAEGLLKSVESDAQHDFIEALNSLAGESRYDADRMDALIDEAHQSLQPKKKPKYDIEALKDEIRKIKKGRNEKQETIKSLEGRIAALKPSIIPGINAFFIVIIGLVLSMIFYLLGIAVIALIAFVGVIIGAGASVIYDMGVLKKQQADIAQKKMRFMNEITQLSSEIEKLDGTIQEKEEFLRSVMPDAQEGPADAS